MRNKKVHKNPGDGLNKKKKGKMELRRKGDSDYFLSLVVLGLPGPAGFAAATAAGRGRRGFLEAVVVDGSAFREPSPLRGLSVGPPDVRALVLMVVVDVDDGGRSRSALDLSGSEGFEAWADPAATVGR